LRIRGGSDTEGSREVDGTKRYALAKATPFVEPVVELAADAARCASSASAGAARPEPTWIPLVGYLLAVLPLTRIPRPLFLHHYFKPLVFSICAVAEHRFFPDTDRELVV
jgi:hypothetical protein